MDKYSSLGKSAKIFSFSEKIRMDISCESSAADDSHEMSSLIFSGKKNRMLSANFVISVLKDLNSDSS